VKSIAGEPVNDGCPPKHAICAAFSLCKKTMAEQFAPSPVRWRCAVGTIKDEIRSKVENILKEVGPDVLGDEDPWAECPNQWPTIKEFMFDFAYSNYRIPDLTGQWDGWVEGAVFKLLLAAESEVQGTALTGRVNLVTRDLVKLCLVNSDVKVLVYKGYDPHDDPNDYKSQMVAAIQRTIERCYKPGEIPGEWLFLGLLGHWPDSQTAYQHILTPENKSMIEKVGW
jgi:hypothetical protein